MNQIRGYSKKSLRLALTCFIAILSMVSLILGFSFFDNQNKINPEDTLILNSSALINSNGWNSDIVKELNSAINKFDDGVALGGADGVNTSTIINLGGIDWLVVYKQNNIVTLYALNSVANLQLNSTDTCYLDSAVRDYLNNTFYPQFLAKVGYDYFENIIVTTGDTDVISQLAGVQNIPLNTIDGQIITSNDIVTGDKVWLPSAYEVGGFEVTNTSPSNRVNSFNTLESATTIISSGLWNLPNNYRTSNDGMWLRSQTSNGLFTYLNDNGEICTTNQAVTLDVRPAINISLPTMDSFGNIVEIVETDNQISNDMNMAYSSTMSGSGTSYSPYLVETASNLVEISSAVLSGETMTGLYFQMVNDIDMSGITVWNPIGLYVEAGTSHPFYGNFDGDGYVVTNLAESSSGLAGVFGYVSNSSHISNLGVTKSTWNTVNKYVGGIASYVDGNAVISACYSECGISGIQYVGGIVGYMTGNASLYNCYNTFGLTGELYVGGLVGYISGEGCTILNSYNIGSTLATVNYSGGIVGFTTSTNGNIYSCFFSNSTDNNTLAEPTKLGTYQVNYEDMRGISTNLYADAGWSIYSVYDPSGIWFLSRVANNYFPMLQIFMKQMQIRMVTNLSAGGSYEYTYDDTTVFLPSECAVGSLCARGTEVSISAFANATYRFVGWYFFNIGLDGTAYFTDDLLADTEDFDIGEIEDYYYLEARFIKIYQVTIEAYYPGFSAGYNGGTLSYSNTGYKFANIYDENQDITIVIDTSKYYIGFVAMNYKRSSGGTYTTVPSDYWKYTPDVDDINHRITYVFTVNNDKSAFGTSNVLYFQAQFIRIFDIHVAMNVEAPVDQYLPTASVQLGSGGTTITAIANGTGGNGYVNYNIDGLISSHNMGAYANMRTFNHWQLTYTSNSTGFNVGNDGTKTISGYTFLNTDYDITLTAYFDMVDYTVTVNSVFNGTKDVNDANTAISFGKVDISVGTTPKAEGAIALNSSASVSLTTNYASQITISFIPLYKNGYRLNGIFNATPSQLTTTITSGVYSYTFTLGSDNPVYTIKYEYIPLNVNVKAQLYSSGSVINFDAGVATTSGAITSGNYYSLLTGLSVAITNTDNIYKRYGIKSVDVAVGASPSTYTTIRSGLTGSAYFAQQTYNNIFENSEKINTIYNSTSTTLTASNTISTVRVLFEYVGKTLTLTSYYENTTSTVSTVNVSSFVSGGDQISAGTDTYIYVQGSTVTVNAEALNIGHTLKGFKTSTTGAYLTANIGASPYMNSGSTVVTVEANMTVYIYYSLRTYSVVMSTNNYSENGVTKSLNDQGITLSVAGVTKTLSQTSTDSQSVSGSYGNVVQFNFVTRKVYTTPNIIVLLYKVELYLDDSTTPSQIFTGSDSSYSFTINQDASSVKVLLTYRIVQSVNIIMSEGPNVALANGGLAKLINDTTGESIFVLLLDTNNLVEIPAGNFRLEFYLPVFYQVKISIDEGATTELETNFEVNIVSGVATEVTIEEVQESLGATGSISFVII